MTLVSVYPPPSLRTGTSSTWKCPLLLVLPWSWMLMAFWQEPALNTSFEILWGIFVAYCSHSCLLTFWIWATPRNIPLLKSQPCISPSDHNPLSFFYSFTFEQLFWKNSWKTNYVILSRPTISKSLQFPTLSYSQWILAVHFTISSHLALKLFVSYPAIKPCFSTII